MDAVAATSAFAFFDVCSGAFDEARCLLDSVFLRSDTPWLGTDSVDLAFEAAEALDLFELSK